MVKKSVQEFDFEQAVQNLEKLVADLENEKINLDDALKKYEAGVGLIRQCHKYLKDSEQKVQILKQSVPQGTLENYATDEDEEHEEDESEI